MAKYKKKSKPNQAQAHYVPPEEAQQKQQTANPPASTAKPAVKVNTEGLRLIEQQRAAFALKRITEAVNKQEGGRYKHSQVKSFSRRFPSMVQANGFGQAAAFFYSKRNDHEAYGVIYQLVEDWLTDEGQVYAAAKEAPAPKLLYAITQGDQQAYRLATAETQALMIWVKKFAQGLIQAEEDSGNDD
ncbi:MAG: type III-B CRISPR module-associated protein Cmr5 [Marinospirillum sp.]|uniref:type III-B CRISPR module-associated protein Cmr5 n=1 Tax=Marinospirillum sp. TaxID=2183934 RepID=UPI0019F4EEDB|nr:type III-B CRISPR module-associated protein Cmr5 [Marinospirillum sp.]MBE0508531.1 type III-B CRISPR module-associated protein Cmr5 [Marinospirillum sp.]